MGRLTTVDIISLPQSHFANLDVGVFYDVIFCSEGSRLDIGMISH
jgi:hypothetical protein